MRVGGVRCGSWRCAGVREGERRKGERGKAMSGERLEGKRRWKKTALGLDLESMKPDICISTLAAHSLANEMTHRWERPQGLVTSTTDESRDLEIAPTAPTAMLPHIHPSHPTSPSSALPPIFTHSHPPSLYLHASNIHKPHCPSLSSPLIQSYHLKIEI